MKLIYTTRSVAPAGTVLYRASIPRPYGSKAPKCVSAYSPFKGEAVNDTIRQVDEAKTRAAVVEVIRWTAQDDGDMTADANADKTLIPLARARLGLDS